MNIGVFGVGNFGETHIKVLQKIPEINIAGLFDPNKQRAQEISKQYQVKLYDDPKDLIKQCDAIDIVSNTNTHFEIINTGIAYNKHIFVEKPICSHQSELKKLIEKTIDYKPIIQVGHIERYNPAAQKGFQETKNIKSIKTKRVGLMSDRNKNTSLVTDLMIHDIDLVFSLIKSPVKSIKAVGSQKINNFHNYVKCVLIFNNNIKAELIAERNYNINIERKMSITCNNKIVGIDLLNRTIDTTNENKLWTIQDNANPLKMELIDFYNNIENGKKPLVGIKESCYAVQTALKIEEIIHNS